MILTERRLEGRQMLITIPPQLVKKLYMVVMELYTELFVTIFLCRLFDSSENLYFFIIIIDICFVESYTRLVIRIPKKISKKNQNKRAL